MLSIFANTLLLRDAGGGSRWFVNAILSCYLAFYISNRIFKKNTYALLCLAALLAVYVLICVRYKLGSWNYNTIACFFMGALFGKLSIRIGKKWFPALPIFGLLMYVYQWRGVTWLEFIIPPVFLIAVLALLNYFNFDNQLLRRFSGFSFELYLIHLTVLGISFKGEGLAQTGTLLVSISIILVLSYALHMLCSVLWRGVFLRSGTERA